MIINKQGYSYNDLTIIPEVISNINSRSECNPFIDRYNCLPIFTAPMASVVNEENINKFSKNGIIPILPRNIDIKRRIYQMTEYQTWVALSLKEFENLFIDNYQDRIGDFRTHYFICVDIANGHMKSLYDKCAKAKKLAKDNSYKLTIMTGNIANPETYEWIIKYNDDNNIKVIDYIRVGIGGGCGCITTSNTSAHYPQASLIDECYKIKKYWKNYTSKDVVPYIIADGGIRNYDHVIKALALGADYVMIGSLFAQCIESAGEKTTKSLNTKLSLRFPIERYKDFSVDSKGNFKAYYTDEYIKEASKTWEEALVNSPNKQHAQLSYNRRIDDLKQEKIIGGIDVKFFGMASADGQKSINGKKTKTSEGITKWLPIKYTLKGWTENMISYLRSAMSYTDCKTLNEFIGKPKLIINSISEIQSINK